MFYGNVNRSNHREKNDYKLCASLVFSLLFPLWFMYFVFTSTFI